MKMFIENHYRTEHTIEILQRGYHYFYKLLLQELFVGLKERTFTSKFMYKLLDFFLGRFYKTLNWYLFFILTSVSKRDGYPNMYFLLWQFVDKENLWVAYDIKQQKLWAKTYIPFNIKKCFFYPEWIAQQFNHNIQWLLFSVINLNEINY